MRTSAAAHPTGNGGETGTDGSAAERGRGPAGDAANLEYARKQTDLVLDKLADQLKQKKVDEELLKDSVGRRTTCGDLSIAWQERKEAAQRNDPQANRRVVSSTMRCGAWACAAGALKQSAVKDDTQRDLREGFRGPVPLEYQERLRAYNQGVSRARQDDE